MIDRISPYTPFWTSRFSERQTDRAERAVESAGPSKRIAEVDPFDAADTDFDFEAASKAAAATLKRDQQQMMLAEMSDAKSQASLGLPAAVAAYSEFDE